MKHVSRILMVVAILASSTLGGFLANRVGVGRVQAAPAQAGFGPNVKLTMLAVPYAGLANLTPTAQKIADVGSITVENAASLVEVTHQGYVTVNTISGSNNVIFELRIDGVTGAGVNVSQPSGIAQFRYLNTGEYLPLTFTGYWYNLPAGTRTVSLWAHTSLSTATNAYIGQGVAQANLVIVKEYLPFGTTYLPNVAR